MRQAANRPQPVQLQQGRQGLPRKLPSQAWAPGQVLVPVRVGLEPQPPARAPQLVAFLGARRHPPQVLYQSLAA